MRCISRLANVVVAIFALAVIVADTTPLKAATAPAIHKVGAVTRHASNFVGQVVFLSGYLLAREQGYILFSDEPKGKISQYDLPVVGAGIDQMIPMKKYVIEGRFVDGDLVTSNANKYHLELIGLQP